ncbi:MAG TPA: DNA polymerase III subunit gamma/tau [Anaerolineales bacterium]|nr:DNA polymerase III subunit gamma/tau [Anaerolineales bacterium]
MEMTQALYRKWRPRTFEEIVGQEHVVRTLRNALNSGRVHHAYLFAGPRGTGKTTTARLLAKAVNCLAPDPADRPCNECAICQAVNEGRLMDLIEIDAASNTGVDDVRELRERIGFRPNVARYKVYVIDEVHMLSNAAFNALLKTLEEPPPHAIFVLATTEPHRIPPTIRSRCQRFDFRRIPLEAIVERLERITRGEEIVAEREALILIARQATGSMRDAESLLDQLAAYTDGGITVGVVRAALGTGAEEAVMGLVDALAEGDTACGLDLINRVVDQGIDPRQFARQVVEHLRGLLLTRLGSEETPLHIPDGLRETFRAQARRFEPRQLARAVRLFNRAAVEARATWQPQLPLELAFVEAALPPGGEPSSPSSTSAPPGRKEVPPPNSAFPSRPTARPSTPAPPRSAERPPAREHVPAATPGRKGGSTPAAATSFGPAVSPEQPPSPRPATERPALSPRRSLGKPAAQESAQPPPSAEEMPSLEAFASRWAQVVEMVNGRDARLAAFLRDCPPVQAEENTLVLGCRYPLHRDKVAEEGNRRVVEDTLEVLFGRSIRVRCELVSRERKLSPSHSAPPLSQTPVRDELVEAAVRELGARVVSGVGNHRDAQKTGRDSVKGEAL